MLALKFCVPPFPSDPLPAITNGHSLIALTYEFPALAITTLAEVIVYHIIKQAKIFLQAK